MPGAVLSEEERDGVCPRWSTVPLATVVALRAQLPNLIVGKPILGLIEPANEFVGRPDNFTSALLMPTAMYVESIRLPFRWMFACCAIGAAVGKTIARLQPNW